MKLEKLTSKQEALIPAVRDEWIKIGLDTAPVDQGKARSALEGVYAIVGKPVPRHIIHLDSPLAVAIALAQLRLGDTQVSDQVSDQVRDQVSAQVRAQVSDQVRAQVSDQVRAQVRAQVSDQVGAQVRDQVGAQVGAQVSDQVRARVRAQVSDLIYWGFWYDLGQFDVWLSWYDFIGRCGVDVSKMQPHFEVAKQCGWTLLFWDWVFVSAKPQFIHRDELGRLHSEVEAAVRYPDGFSVFSVHGVRVPEKVILAPQSLTPAEIDAEKNAEVRRVMIERYGQDHYLMESKAEEIHRDDFGVLYRKQIEGDEPLVMVKVVNSTAEPDGSFKDYFIRVPPTMERARQAVAWTFGKTEMEYQPAIQS